MRHVPVSVVINTLDRRDHLERTLLSLRDQIYPSFEVIVVNGPSRDGTAEMLEAHRDRARLETCDVACLGRSRNVGLDAAAGDIVAFVDDDAIPDRRWLESLVRPYLDDARVAAVGGPVFDVPLARVAWDVCTCTRLGDGDQQSPRPVDPYVARGADPFVYLPGCNMSFRRDVLVKLGGFNEQLAYGYDDVEVCCRIVDAGYDVRVLEEVLVRHDRAPNATRDDRQALRDPYDVLFSKAIFVLQCASPIDEQERLVALSSSVVDHEALARELHRDGQLDDRALGVFLERARTGVRDGIAAVRLGNGRQRRYRRRFVVSD